MTETARPEYTCPHIRCELYSTCQLVEEDDPEPCKCHTSFAYIAPMHDGHCCFQPASQTCHPTEVAEWERQRDLRRPSSALVSVEEDN